MGYTLVALEDKILQLHPEIAQMGIAGKVFDDPERSADIVRLKKGETAFSLHLEREDADDCMQGLKCINLAVQMAQFIEEFKEAERGPL